MKRKLTLAKTFIVFIVLAAVATLGITTVFAFSDILEPYYPHVTASLRSTEEIFNRMTGPNVELKEGVAETRMKMIEMYQSVGIDVTYDMEHWSGSDYMELSFPQRYSRETPIPLGTSPDYSGAFSIDAPWNNKIPKDSPRVELSRNCLSFHCHMGVVKSKLDQGGGGTGIAQVVGFEGDQLYSIVDKYFNAKISKIYQFPVPENVLDLVNLPANSDEHTEFIDGNNHTSVQAWYTRVPGDTRGYGINNFLLPQYDVRTHSLGYETRLDGIGAEGICGVNAAKPPTSAFTIKSSEISSTTEMINHALGGAIGETCGARVYPATMTDAHMQMTDSNTGSNGQFNRGVVPYGGVIQLDPELDLDAIYNAGKLSWHSYRILRAMQEYGFYNIDTSGSSFFFYTTTYGNDWLNPDEPKFNVPIKDNAQGNSPVTDELTAFFAGDEFFGLEELPKVYVVPIVTKMADLDVNDDGAIDQADHDLVLEHYDVAYTDQTKQYDVNEDKVIDMSDVEIMYRYLENLPMHTWTYYDFSLKDNDVEHGEIYITGPNDKVDGITRYREGFWVTVAAVPKTGYEFDGWTGDFEGKDQYVKLIVDKDYTIGAKYKKIDKYVKVTTKVAGPGHIEVSEDNLSFDAPSDEYPNRTLLKIKAVPDEGKALLGWYGDVSGYSQELDLLLEKATEIIALFGDPDYVEEFHPDEWYAARGSDNFKVDDEKNSISLLDFNESRHVIVKNKYAKNSIDLKGNFKLRATMNPVLLLATHGTHLIFNFKDIENYYYFRIDCNGASTLGKYYKGKEIIMDKCEAKQTTKDGTVMELPLDVEIQRKNSFIIVNLYKNGRKMELMKTRDKTFTGGVYGVGSSYYGVTAVSNIMVSKSELEPTDATKQTWVRTGASDIWSKKLTNAVVVCLDNSNTYAKNDYRTLGTNKPFYVEGEKDLYVPVKYVVENLGGSVAYDAVSDVIAVALGNNSVDYKDGMEGVRTVDGVLYVAAPKLAKDIGKQLWKYHDVVFFSDIVGAIYTASNENECNDFVKKTFGVEYELYTNVE